MGHDDVFGHLADPRVQALDGADGQGRPGQLGQDERWCGRWPDPGEGIGEHAGKGDRRVGEAGGGGEEVGATDVGRHSEGRGRGPSRTDHSEYHEQQAEGGHHLGQPDASVRAGLGRQLKGGPGEHEVGHNRPGVATGELSRDVAGRRLVRDAPEVAIGQGDHRVEMGPGDRPDGQDDRHQRPGGGRRVLEELQAHVSWRQPYRGDA